MYEVTDCQNSKTSQRGKYAMTSITKDSRSKVCINLGAGYHHHLAIGE